MENSPEELQRQLDEANELIKRMVLSKNVWFGILLAECKQYLKKHSLI